ncbi:MAG TPA: hypothetical protein PLQ63_01645 [Propionicimonas sp.]|nr:hypothetical protein [Propionicimonas sp.]
MTTPSRLIAAMGAVVALAFTGCAQLDPTTSPTASASVSPTATDFTMPGKATAMVDELLAKNGSKTALMVEVTESTVQVSMLDASSKPSTWAYRNGEIAQVPSDLAYVDQATFEVSRFNFSDVGALFRAAAGMSGSEQDQSLTIVDYSGGEVVMSVSTVPESRTVFFNADGSLLPVLDFDTPGGIARGIEEAVGTRATVASITVESEQGAWVDYPADTETTVRRTRTAKVPVTTNVRAEKVELPMFNAARVDPASIWKVVDGIRGTQEVPEQSGWSVVIDDRDAVGAPRMHFTIGSKVVVTDLAGNLVSG